MISSFRDRQISARGRSKSVNQKEEKQSPLATDASPISSRGKSWTYEENQQYILFLEENKKSFDDEQTRRFSKIFLEMSLNMLNKSPEQCRTHHQKALRKYKSIDRIISFILSDTEQRIEKQRQPEEQVLEEKEHYRISCKGNQLNISLDQSFFEGWWWSDYAIVLLLKHLQIIVQK